MQLISLVLNMQLRNIYVIRKINVTITYMTKFWKNS